LWLISLPSHQSQGATNLLSVSIDFPFGNRIHTVSGLLSDFF
jgi:hypothetical protein